MLTACASSEPSIKDLPPLPSSVANAGKVTPWPQAEYLDDLEARNLLGAVRENELRQARAVTSCIHYHNQLTFLFNKKK